jgi:serine/threonine protein kinase
LPNWEGLRNRLTDDASNNAKSLNKDDLAQRNGRIKAIRAIESHWKAFEMLEDMAPASFQGVIRRELVESLRCPIPSAYSSVWNLNIKGMMTLNIDGLASRAFRASTVGELRLYERSGFNISTLVGTLTENNSRFIANLHGSSEDPQSWVFTERRLLALLNDSKYCEFVSDCVKYSTIVLLGISAQDRAVIEHFQKTMLQFPNSGPHFWITSSDQQAAAAQVEQAGVRSTLYSNTDGQHSFITDIFNAVRAYKPSLDFVEPVQQMADGNAPASLPPPNELISESPNEIRSILNQKAAAILAPESTLAYQEFESFCREYSRAIHSATFVSQEPQNHADQVGRFRAHSYVKEGGFAKVWYGSSTEGEPVAIKVFRHEIREQPELLKAFRRGVRSMRYLQHRNVPGVVRFMDASEIPPVVVMEWIEGITLHDAVKQGASHGWRNKIRIANDLAKAVYAVHNTPERIIHRDLRPQNVMLRDYYSDQDNAEIVVLDFDLSWHLGALEKSVYVSGGTSYLAPEQLNERVGMSTRSATVDSFGFGMTLYYITAGTDPVFFGHVRPDWSHTVMAICEVEKCKEWRSLPKRVARLIIAATLDDQNRRLTFGQIVAETEKLWNALESPAQIRDLSLIAEECFARVQLFSSYEMTEAGTFSYKSPSGVTFELEPYAPQGGLLLRVSFVQSGHEKYQILEKVGQEFKAIRDRFSRHFDVLAHTCNLNHGDFHVELTTAFDGKEGFIERFSRTLNEVSNILIQRAGAY